MGGCVPVAPRARATFGMWLFIPLAGTAHQLLCLPGPWWCLRSVRYASVDFAQKVNYMHAGNASRPWATLGPGRGANITHMLSPAQLFCLSAPGGNPCMCIQALFRKEPNRNFSSKGMFARRRGPFPSFFCYRNLNMPMTDHPRRCGVHPWSTRHLHRCLGPFVVLVRKPPPGPGHHRNVLRPR
jgi:hypothetical protein